MHADALRRSLQPDIFYHDVSNPIATLRLCAERPSAGQQCVFGIARGVLPPIRGRGELRTLTESNRPFRVIGHLAPSPSNQRPLLPVGTHDAHLLAPSLFDPSLTSDASYYWLVTWLTSWSLGLSWLKRLYSMISRGRSPLSDVTPLQPHGLTGCLLGQVHLSAIDRPWQVLPLPSSLAGSSLPGESCTLVRAVLARKAYTKPSLF